MGSEKLVQIYPERGRKRMLDLHAVALVAVLDDADTGTTRVDIDEVLGELLRHEQHCWYDSARFGIELWQEGGHGRAADAQDVAAVMSGS